MAAQRFGGPWSLVKIETVAKYLQAFNKVLKNQPFERVYIDAFAGSGDFSFGEGGAGPLFDKEKAALVHAGSARRALETEPPFHRLFFVENDPKNIAALEQVADSDPKHRATVVPGDANREVQSICERINWASARGVIFLDPFGNSVDWETIKALSTTNLDVWYLFPLAGVYRNAPRAIL